MTAKPYLHTYEILASWEPGKEDEPKAGMGRKIRISMPPDEDGYARFDDADGSGWEGRHVGSHELTGAVGEAIARINELNETEEGRGILREAFERFKQQQKEKR